MSDIATSDVFRFDRFLRLLHLTIRRERGVWITLAGVFAFFLLFSLVRGYTGRPESYLYNYMGIFFAAGIVQTGRSFRYYYRRERNTSLLMVPASKPEKWLEKYLLTTVVWGVASFIVFSVYAFVSAGLNELLFGFHTSPLWWDGILLEFYLHYLVVHSIFFLGAAVFRNTSMFKTVISFFIISVVITLLTALFARIMFGDLFHFVMDLSNNQVQIGPHDLAPKSEAFFNNLGQIMKVIYWAVLGPYCLITSYVRFTEIEVKDGV